MTPITLTPAHTRIAEALFWLGLASCYVLLPEHLSLMSQILIFGLFAVSLDMALGYAGILTVGHAAFFGAGAYAAGLLAKHGWGEPFSGVLMALAVCVLLGYLLSALVVRGTDLARLMITIGVCMLLAELANRLSGITGGTDGLQGMVVEPLFGRFEFDLFGQTAFLYAFAMVLLVFLGVRLILKSPFGLTLRGIHDSRKRMLAIGSPVDARLRLAYALSAGVAGIAGALLAQTTQFVGIESIGFNRSAEILIILVLGGTGRLYGGLVGAIVYMLVHDWFADMNPQYWQFWLGIFLIAAVLLGRGGIMGALSRLFRTQEEAAR
ncbi:MAG: branched-chain amino acid ABC transporter permease [Hydrogenophaga sp.]|uniref:branched-chain amino acid ABC transporter permease n=1 Tax=Hydrogenophaga sp. TaxID=1904254 RepID=UPI0016B61256|nr:branched-chain amino acid ABC transporter permease [Hydrogenophaga sp.]NIM43903.1 branched-chain amino acid ABC transporter permease [Hydrogenophaga sp.]NIN28969.1 branched-chain amino acid ABC transporter permease [Hydrogenophaga sp.]NIN33428.1 branched-chain amino acid ABC transporter permease [Hydrogenophaga sp.]NIN58103.1 branched-chain amino acid ABC transporter permease [Hydrogenophaga sp.]NIO54401.1 branched-chain amino acid ABC transporter permease [Hydrogenophaga sp.]